jgi:hypothetical protein
MTQTMPFQQTVAGCRMEEVDRWEVEEDGMTVGVQVTRPRLVPWLRIARVPRFGRDLRADSTDRIVKALAVLARERPVLRLFVEVWSENQEDRRRVAEACRRHGFQRSSSPRSYVRTIWMDLRPSEKEILASFHATGRRHIRAPGKKGYQVQSIEDPAAAPAVDAIFQDTFARTGGAPPAVDWAWVIQLNGSPDAPLRLVGLYPEDAPDSSDPVSFAMALLHGEVAEYAHAGSVRDRSLRIPLLYAPTWELMRWARSRGARYWDFGGVTGGSADDDDPMGGISDFKRYFSTALDTVGEEWILRPRPLQDTIARSVSRWLRRGARF